MARLEAQKAICDASEKELHKKHKEIDEFETQIKPEWEQARKRSRMDDALAEEKDSTMVLYLQAIKPRTPLCKELKVSLEEEQKASDAALSQINEDDRRIELYEELERPKKRLLEIEGKHKFQFPVIQEPEIVEDKERRKKHGKGNLEKWLQILLDSSPEETSDIISQMNLKYLQGVKNVKCPQAEVKGGVSRQHLIVQEKDDNAHQVRTPVKPFKGVINKKSFEERDQSNGKEEKLPRSESARAF
ncbi:trichohyalin [Pyrus ussuriensis x Pyrus communis]|uniref:Trichohyalin n=1 Tax=Pyrus ussuriensis x Pyrus communis TaxID=2448454 RepID=A0A5N5HAE3_9ROSA|nr:trichohyalin [Pyrus ussuriensis x Pyrus communis]